MDIQIRNLTKRYGEQLAVHNVSFDVKPGEILGFLGPNGAGKTTTMKTITTFLPIEEGEILIGGKSISENGQSLRKHIGYLPEHNPLYTDMPVMDYLAFCASLQGVPRPEIQDRIKDMIRLCGLNREKHKLISELSKGYRQRVGLAQAMIHNPDVLILDEPTTGLDPNQIVEIRELIKTLGREKTVILSTHILPEVEATCDRIMIINRGKIVADGTAETLRKQAEGKEIIQCTIEDGQPEEVFKAVEALPGVAEVSIDTQGKMPFFLVTGKPEASNKRAIFSLCVSRNWVLTGMNTKETRLEDIFRNLTLN